jgi:L-fuculose-phosphate aldolase
MTHAALGHVSYRLDDDTMLIKGKGPNETGLKFATARDIIKVDFNADLVEGPDDLQPPSESFLHIWVYKNRPEVKSVVHCHPEHAVLLTIARKPIFQIYGAYHGSSQMARQGVPLYESSATISNDQLGQDFVKVMGDSNVALLLGHGIATAGTGIEQSVLNALNLEILCSMMYKAYLLGDPQPVPEAAMGGRGGRGIGGPEEMPAGQRRTRGSVGGVEGMMATWRYYVALAEERAGRKLENPADLASLPPPLV